VLQLARRAGLEPDERQLSALADTAAWMACVARNLNPGIPEYVKSARKLSLDEAPTSWHLPGAANVMAKLFDLSLGDVHEKIHEQLVSQIKSTILNNQDEIWAELEREQHLVTRFDRHSKVRDWPAQLLRIVLPMCDLAGASLSADAAQNPDLLAGLDLSGVSLEKADLRGMNLDGVRLRRTELGRARLDNAKLRGADLSGAHLMYANLRKADLSGALLDGACFARTDLIGAVLNGVSFAGATFSDARMHEVWMTLAPSLLAGIGEASTDSCGAILRAIETIDNNYGELKSDLMVSLVGALARSTDSVNARDNARSVRDSIQAGGGAYSRLRAK
jgi:uncharacterized protein YjbI with pentapeptide repeats